MRFPAFSAVAATALALGTAAPAIAQVPAPDSAPTSAAPTFRRPFEIGLTGGIHLFAADHGLGRAEGDPEGLSPAHAPAVGARVGYGFTRFFGLEGEFLVSKTTTRDEQADLWVFGYRGHFILQRPSGVLRPFLLVGAGGLNSVSTDSSVVPSDADWMYHAGFGAKLVLGDAVGVRLEGRALFPPAVFANVLAVGDETHYGGPDIEALASFYLAFGVAAEVVVREKVVDRTVPDADHDGILDAADKCPMQPEDLDGFQDDDGCPEWDNDDDGVPDPRDSCPMQPEDRDGYKDEDGCPDPDNDGDAIPDGEDKCPVQAGPRENGGCPDEDKDADGLVDRLDKCPDRAETKNGYQDEDGCPDEVPKEVRKFTGVIRGINFKTGSAEIVKRSFKLLDQAALVLKAFPEVRLEISGHTDDQGDPAFNKSLSQRRADAVRDHLVSNGIAPDRLVSVGFGPDRPIASNTSRSGRAKNRRTEFRLIGTGEAAPATPSSPPQTPISPKP